MICVAIVAHHSRGEQAAHLAGETGGRLFVDDGTLGSWTNHRRAWLWCAIQNQPWTLVLEDDAIPIPGVINVLADGLGYLPSDGLVSLYLGTGYPVRWQTGIRAMLDAAGDAAWARSRYLLHGVAIAAPTDWATAMVNQPAVHQPYDEHLSRWARIREHPIYYTLPSLVDHADHPSLIHRTGRDQPRHAWQVGTPNWNNRTVELL